MSARPSVELILRDAYEFAHLVRGCADNSSTILELPWDDPECRRGLTAFSKVSLLHRYIFAMVAWHERELFQQKDDLFDDDHSLIEDEEHTTPRLRRRFSAVQRFSENALRRRTRAGRRDFPGLGRIAGGRFRDILGARDRRGV